jgi:hypothetical protein
VYAEDSEILHFVQNDRRGRAENERRGCVRVGFFAALRMTEGGGLRMTFEGIRMTAATTGLLI